MRIGFTAYLMSISNANSQETLTADAVEGFLRQNEINVLIENGGMKSLHRPMIHWGFLNTAH